MHNVITDPLKNLLTTTVPLRLSSPISSFHNNESYSSPRREKIIILFGKFPEYNVAIQKSFNQ